MAAITNVQRGTGARLAWIGVLAAPIAWGAQLLVGYSMQEAGCGRPNTHLWGASLDLLTMIALVVSGMIAVAGGAAAVAALRACADNDPRGRVFFMALSGIVATVIFAVAIVLTAIPLFSLDSCTPG